MYGNKSKITRGDIIAAAKKRKKNGVMVAKRYQSPSGGLNAAGRRYLKAKDII